ncbi:protein of unknown function (plasmid) [Paraburkholderia dioscoreae]|uniref:Uncharacterized protein n=1 Tax=Paraburkholderia dioscoreae TaxID=2604047 RepID=A0A5Q4YWQ1_9BURK|nr:protein of unknown function [Paraburkholderia dioscoreae]
MRRAAATRAVDLASGAQAPGGRSDEPILSNALLKIASAEAACAGWLWSEAQKPPGTRRGPMVTPIAVIGLAPCRLRVACCARRTASQSAVIFSHAQFLAA